MDNALQVTNSQNFSKKMVYYTYENKPSSLSKNSQSPSPTKKKNYGKHPKNEV